MYRQDLPGFSADMAAPEVLFALIDNLPYVEWLPYVVLVVLAIFFITAADSASVVMGMLTTQGDQNPRRGVIVFWGLVMSGIAIVMLLLGDAMALTGLQQLVIITAVPFSLILILILIAWFRELRTDPMALRIRYTQSALNNAVTDGVERFGDDFALKVGKAKNGSGAGAEVDSLHEAYTQWYQRTNEDGEPVGYNFETGEWADGYDPESVESPSATSDQVFEDPSEPTIEPPPAQLEEQEPQRSRP